MILSWGMSTTSSANVLWLVVVKKEARDKDVMGGTGDRAQARLSR